VARADSALPASQRTSVKRNYIPIALLLVAAMVMSVMLWRGLENTKSSTITSVVDNVVVGPVSVTSIRSYDPNGEDGLENEDMIQFLTDNNPDTSWTTVCYGNQYFGSKTGVGILVQLSGIGLGTLATTFGTAPWSAEVFASTSETVPTSLDGWGLRVANASSLTAGAATFEVASPARNVLLVLREAGRTSTCSNNNPFRGSLSELSFTSAK
jgi:hypothetical protein